MDKTKISAKDVMKPHSEAKVLFYQKYLDIKRMILVCATFAREIHIYDLVCGRGIYADGKKGSPIRAYETICNVRHKRPGYDKPIYLHLNDRNRRCIEKVRGYIEALPKSDIPPCNVEYTNMDATSILMQLGNSGKTKKGIVNVFFIDPYGYKQISRKFLEYLLRLGSSEILLFLPVSFMQRFTKHAFSKDVTPGSLPLRHFITDYFPEGHPMRTGHTIDIGHYVDYLAEAFSCGGQFFTTAYPIERNEHNLFALFFFSRHIFSYEKILDIKWKMIDQWGFGFHLPDEQAGLFEEQFKADRIAELLEQLRVALVSYLAQKVRTNKDIYDFTVRHGYLPKHAKAILRDMRNNNQLSVMDIMTREEISNKNRFDIEYKKETTLIYKIL